MINLEDFTENEGFGRWHEHVQEKDGFIYATDSYICVRKRGSLKQKPIKEPNNYEDLDALIKIFESEHSDESWTLNIEEVESVVSNQVKPDKFKYVYIKLDMRLIPYEHLLKLKRINKIINLKSPLAKPFFMGKSKDIEFIAIGRFDFEMGSDAIIIKDFNTKKPD